MVKHMLQVRCKGKAYNKGLGNIWCKVKSRSNLRDAVQKEHRAVGEAAWLQQLRHGEAHAAGKELWVAH